MSVYKIKTGPWILRIERDHGPALEAAARECRRTNQRVEVWHEGRIVWFERPRDYAGRR